MLHLITVKKLLTEQVTSGNSWPHSKPPDPYKTLASYFQVYTCLTSVNVLTQIPGLNTKNSSEESQKLKPYIDWSGICSLLTETSKPPCERSSWNDVDVPMFTAAGICSMPSHPVLRIHSQQQAPQARA